MLEIAILGFSVFANLMIGLFVYAKNTRSATNRIFGLLAITLATWPLINYFSIHTPESPFATLLFIRGVMCAIVLQDLFFYWLAVTFPDARFKFTKARVAELAFSLALGVLTFTPLIFSQVIISGSNINPTPSYGMPLFVLDLLYFVVGGLLRLFHRLRRGKPLERAQMRYMISGFFAMYGLSILTNFVLVLALHLSKFVILSPLYTTFFAIFLSIAIINKRLFDIRLVVARSVAYILLLLTLGFVYVLATFTLSSYIFPGEHFSTAYQIFNVISALVLAFIFQPLRRFFEHVTDKIFYRDRYDSQEVLNTIAKVLTSELHLQKLLDGSLKIICDNLRVGYGQFMVFDEGRIYTISHYGPLPDRILTAPSLNKIKGSLVISDELDPGERKDIMTSHGIRLKLTLRSNDQFVGYLLLGDKMSGDIYSNQDIELLEILGKEMAIAITNAKAYEEIARFNETLQEKIRQATSRLRVANRNLKALDKTKDEFLSMASHQLRTPLTTIKGYISMLLEGDAGQLNKEQTEFLNFALDGAQRMVGLIADLLNVSRLSAGRFLIDKQPTDIVKVMSEEVRQLLGRAEQKGLDLIFDYPKQSLPLVELDEGKTRQVIMNFIDNAVYYTQKGGVFVTVEYDKKEEVVRIKVRDTGIGVPPEAQKKLFTKFYRAENAQQVRPDGTGLGLYLARRVVEDQGGKIIFESTPGKGSVFGFEMPVKAVKSEEKPAAKPAEPKKIAKTKVTA